MAATTGRTEYVAVPKPPALPWNVLAHVTHLSNGERMPIPMILEATRDLRGTSIGQKADFTSPRPSRFFTVSKKGRTVADFSSPIPQSPVRNTGRSPVLEGFSEQLEEVRLPSYMNNPYDKVVFQQLSDKRADNTKKENHLRRGSRRRSSVSNLFTDVVAKASQLAVLGDVREDEYEPPREFQASTFTRHSLNVGKLRELERHYSEREQLARRKSAEDNGLLSLPAVNVQGSSARTEYDVTPRLVAQDVQLEVECPPTHHTTPRAIAALMSRAQCQHSGRSHDDTIDWVPQFSSTIGGHEHRASKATADSSASQPKDQHTLDSEHYALAVIASASGRSGANGIPQTASGNGVSLFVAHDFHPLPRPLGHPNFGSKAHFKRSAQKKDPQCTGTSSQGRTIVEDPLTHSVSLMANPFREIGREVLFRATEA